MNFHTAERHVLKNTTDAVILRESDGGYSIASTKRCVNYRLKRTPELIVKEYRFRVRKRGNSTGWELVAVVDHSK